MNILCKTKEELKKVLEKLENSRHTWKVITWDWDYDFDDYKNSVTAAQFLAAADLNTEKEGKATGKILFSRDEFDKAVETALEEISNDQDMDKRDKMLVSWVGTAFAEHVGRILFKEDKNNGSK